MTICTLSKESPLTFTQGSLGLKCMVGVGNETQVGPGQAQTQAPNPGHGVQGQLGRHAGDHEDQARRQVRGDQGG